MSRRFLKKIRNFRLMSGLIIVLLTILSFQNCAPAQKSCTGDSKNCASDEATQQSSNSSSSSRDLFGGSNGQGNLAGGGGGSVGSNGGSSTGGGGGIIIGGGTGGGGGGGGGGGTGGVVGGTDTTFRILKNINNQSVREGESFTFEVSIAGGAPPYKFQWFKDNKALSGALGQYSFYSDEASSYTKEGIYYAEVTDGNGQRVVSASARLSIEEPQVGCEKGSYFTFTQSQYDIGTNYFGEYFDGPRGKFLLHKSYDIQNILYNYAKDTGLSAYEVTANLAYKGTTYINCRTAIPRIHTPKVNPGWSSDKGNYNGQYNDGYNYKYEGQVTFACHNKKLLFKSNSCKWVYTPPKNTK